MLYCLYMLGKELILMKKFVMILLAALLLFSAQAALADNMQVVNCDEWVSLRIDADTSSERLAKVPAGAIVTSCLEAGDFVYCLYEGTGGYILADYLTPVEESPIVNGLRLETARSYQNDGEQLAVECYDESGALLWTRELISQYATELDMTDAFVAGTAEQPCVALITATEGFTLVDGFTGEELWHLASEDTGLYGGVVYAVSEDGTIYIGGYYGPDPVAISMSGEVLWQAQAAEDAYWMYRIDLEEDGVLGVYECIGTPETSGRILYSYEGEELEVQMN